MLMSTVDGTCRLTARGVGAVGVRGSPARTERIASNGSIRGSQPKSAGWYLPYEGGGCSSTCHVRVVGAI
eukprot:3091551-Prymnesium_polylepis.2